MRLANFCIVFDLGWDKAYLSRHTDTENRVSFQRAKAHKFGYHEFDSVEGFKASYKRYTERYGSPIKVVLNGADIEGYQAEVVANLIVGEAI